MEIYIKEKSYTFKMLYAMLREYVFVMNFRASE